MNWNLLRECLWGFMSTKPGCVDLCPVTKALCSGHATLRHLLLRLLVQSTLSCRVRGLVDKTSNTGPEEGCFDFCALGT